MKKAFWCWVALIAAAVACAKTGSAAAQIWTAPITEAAEQLLPNQYIWGEGEAYNKAAWAEEGPVRISISLARQRLYVWRGDRLIGAASVSTGAKGHSTPQGVFTIQQKAAFHRSNIYSGAPMPYMQRLTWTGIAIHAGQNPGHPASHGCVRLPYAFARDLFRLTRLGVEVTIAEYPEQRFWLSLDNGIWSTDDRVTGGRPHWLVVPRLRYDLKSIN